ncbi:Retrovirus-related Pol polyprotein [Thelohanellus kitauei]|uniref:Retrovirus-related Pol polyprotein n=1 Tax=Thelohanellus kitauei TaxID=669202 RepID=A0A0C2MH93_THEKT|nr:Retrovirus-related Pol polyprotein [Thelohanellus kitauei]
MPCQYDSHRQIRSEFACNSKCRCFIGMSRSCFALQITRWIKRPISHASKTLTDQQRKYSQMEREGLAIIYDLKMFHQYLYCRTFEIITDNKGILSLFDSRNKFIVLASQRIHRWNLLLMAYDYKITFRATKQHSNVDAISRQHIGPDNKCDQAYSNCANSTTMIDTQINYDVLKLETKRDPILQKSVDSKVFANRNPEANSYGTLGYSKSEAIYQRSNKDCART